MGAKSLRRLGITVALAAGLIIPLSGVAQACNAGNMCAWTGFSGTGTRYTNVDADSSWPAKIRNLDRTQLNNGQTNGLYYRSYADDGYSGTTISCISNANTSPWHNVQFEPTPLQTGQSHIWTTTSCQTEGP